jgi:bifunctional non-homologous end joining protein LigD
MGSLKEYRGKRRFGVTPEPRGKSAAAHGNSFVVQKHAATRLHYDFRLEIGGVLKSWAVPKGPSLNPADKRLAVLVEDHPLQYGGFEGVIPEGQYGAGEVIVWDRGTFEAEGGATPQAQLERGDFKFTLHGHKLRGSFVLVKLRRSAKGNEWLLIKHRDAAADSGWKIDEHDGSVLSGRTLDDVAEGRPGSAPAGLARPADLEGARKAAFPARLEPALATLEDRPFSDPAWLFEIKWDGVRALSRVRDGRVELRSRTGRDITSHYPELADLPSRLDAREALLDGEIVVLDERGRSDFERLQSRMSVSGPPAALLKQAPVVYYVFDALYCDGYDLREVPLLDRKEFLRTILRSSDVIRFSDHQIEKGKELFALAAEQGLEGIVAKQIRGSYSSGRGRSWLKFKTQRELDAVIGGWTSPQGSREFFGALLLGLYDGGKLRFIGSVGSGFTQKTQKEIFNELQGLKTKSCPFAEKPNLKAFWVKPALVARVKYGNWTREPRLRAPVFLNLRRDRAPSDCEFAAEMPASPAAVPEPAASVVSSPRAERALVRKGDIEKELFHGRAENATLEIDGKPVRLTHLNKVYFPEDGYTKRDLLAYYFRIATHLLPFLKDRPMVLRRYPDGIHGESFFQKEAAATAPEWMETVAVHSEGRQGTMHYFLANDLAALLYLTNLGCIDHNPWSSRRDDLDHPDYVFFDLDPTPGTKFAIVVGLARKILEKLQGLGLRVFLKTSGATGMHLYVPLERRYTYEQVRSFADILGRLVALEEPEHVTLERSVQKRPRGRVLLDAYQNSSGKPLAAPYTVRAFPKAPVSAPLSPDELRATLRPEKFNLKNMPERVEKRGDLWSDFWKSRQTLEAAIEALSAGVTTQKTKRR